MSSFPAPGVISTARLNLREFRPGDDGLVAEVMSTGQPEALPPNGPLVPGDIGAWLAVQAASDGRESRLDLMMFDRAAGRIIGGISLYRADWNIRAAEVGYGVRDDVRGKGYATEALTAVASWALSGAGLQRVSLSAVTGNVASVRVAEKAGFRREGTLRRAALEDGAPHDLAVFSRLDDDR
ncbi:MAG TPA: GNAT family N-acetyltransferase [Trebonia sp.]|jgi:RimJ/RimL family protein N-acetyltransferase